jgi:hypothetical protein
MKSVKIVLVCCALTLLVPLVAQAQDPIVYPSQGQSNEQVEKDKYEYFWNCREICAICRSPCQHWNPGARQSERFRVACAFQKSASVGFLSGQSLSDS